MNSSLKSFIKFGNYVHRILDATCDVSLVRSRADLDWMTNDKLQVLVISLFLGKNISVQETGG